MPQGKQRGNQQQEKHEEINSGAREVQVSVVEKALCSLEDGVEMGPRGANHIDQSCQRNGNAYSEDDDRQHNMGLAVHVFDNLVPISRETGRT